MRKINPQIRHLTHLTSEGVPYAVTVWATYQEGIYCKSTPAEKIRLNGKSIPQVIAKWVSQNQLEV